MNTSIRRARRRVRRSLVCLIALVAVFGGPLLVEDAVVSAAQAQHPMPGELVAVGDHRLHVVRTGSGGPSVVFESGSGEVASGWESVAEGLEGRTTVVRYDRAGTGRSEPSSAPRTGTEIAAELHAALEAVGAPKPYILVGHSLGGLYVREYTRLYPDDVAGLVLVDARPEDDARRTADLVPDGAGTSALPPWIPSLLKATGVLRLGDGALLDGLVPAAHRSEFLNVTASSTYFMTQREEADLIASTENALRGQDLDRLPVRIISRGLPQDYAAAGVDDETGVELERIWRDGQRRMLGLSTDSRIVIAEKSGHLVPMDQPAIIVQEVGDLLDEVKRQRHG